MTALQQHVEHTTQTEWGRGRDVEALFKRKKDW